METLCVYVCVSSAGCISGCEFPFPVSSPGAPPFPDELCVVFVVELDKGPYGLGMGLIDGLVSSERLLHFLTSAAFSCLIYLVNEKSWKAQTLILFNYWMFFLDHWRTKLNNPSNMSSERQKCYFQSEFTW